MLRVGSETKHTELTLKPKPVLDVETAGSQTVALAAMQDATDGQVNEGLPVNRVTEQGNDVNAFDTSSSGRETDVNAFNASNPGQEIEVNVSNASSSGQGAKMENRGFGKEVREGFEATEPGADDEVSLCTAHTPGMQEKKFRQERRESAETNDPESIGPETIERITMNPETNELGRNEPGKNDSDRSQLGKESFAGQESGGGNDETGRRREMSRRGSDVGRGSDSNLSVGSDVSDSGMTRSTSDKSHSRSNSRQQSHGRKKRDLAKEAEELFQALPESVRKNVSHHEVKERLDAASADGAEGGSEKQAQQTGVMATLVSDAKSEESAPSARRSSHRRSNSQPKLSEKLNESVQQLSASAKEVLDYAPRPLTPLVALFYRLCRDGSVESLTWNEAGEEEIQELLHFAKLCMGAYSLTAEDAVKDSEYVVKVESVAKLVVHDSSGKCPAHIIYLDKERRDIVLAVRGLDMTSVDDFFILEDNSRGAQPYGDGFVHAGFYKAAQWLVEHEGPFIKDLVKEHPDFRLVMVGHSLGAGIAMTFTMLVTDNPQVIGGLRPEQIRCYGVAPPRCFSLGLSVKYAHVINSVVLQDDFLPRISTATVTAIFPLAGKTNCFCRFIVNYACWSLCKRCLRDTFVSQKHMLQDPYRLYPPGRVYHVVHKHPCTCSCAKAPTKVKTDIPVKSRFERAVLTGSTFFDHNLTALIKVLKTELHVPDYRPVLQPPSEQKLQRQSTMRREQGRALKQMADVDTMRRDKRKPQNLKPQTSKPAPSKPPPVQKYPGLIRQNSRRLFPRELEMLGSMLGRGPGEDRPTKALGPFTRSILQRSMSTPQGGLELTQGEPPGESTEAAAAAAVARADGREAAPGFQRTLTPTRSLDLQATPRNTRSLSLVLEESVSEEPGREAQVASSEEMDRNGRNEN